jgi:hypothetical protein
MVLPGPSFVGVRCTSEEIPSFGRDAVTVVSRGATDAPGSSAVG